MNYLCYLFFDRLPNVLQEVRFIDGKEQTCLVIPADTNQLKKGKTGNWMMIFRMAECPPNARQQTHDIQLTYLTEEALQKSYNAGYHRRTAHLGRAYEHDRTPEKKIDRTNYGTDLNCTGHIILSDIPKNLRYFNASVSKTFVGGLRFKSLTDPNIIFTGIICLNDIPSEYIKIDPPTGKKYIDAIFKKLPKCDTYMNTHQLVIATASGTEIEIGKFKEWTTESKIEVQQTDKSEYEQHQTTVTPRDTSFSIDGIKY